MNILYTLNSGHPGGMEQHVLDLTRGMVNEGHKVFIWCNGGAMVSRYKEAGAQVEIHKIRLEGDPLYILRLFSFLRREKIDVLHAHELKAVSNSLVAGFLAGTPVRISHTHTPISEWQISPWKKRLNIIFNSFFVNTFSTAEIALTESRKRVKIEEGIHQEKLRIIPNAVAHFPPELSSSQRMQVRREVLGRYDISEDAFVFGNISRISQEKGHSILVHAFKKFLTKLEHKDRPADVVLFLGGGGPLEEELKQQVHELGLQQKIVITGRFPQEDLEKFYVTFDTFVFPSLAEGFGIVLIEAMSHGLPVIASDLEVLQEVGGSTVRYFETGDDLDLAEKMFDVYTRREQYAEFGRKARQRVEELFTMENFIGKYLDLYRELLI